MPWLRPLLVMAALGLGFAAQWLLGEERPNLALVAPLFLGAALLAALSLPSFGPSLDAARPTAEQKGTHRGTLPLLILSLGSLVFSLYLLQRGQWPEVATVAWVGALAAFAGAFASRQPAPRQLSQPFSLGEGALLGLILAVSFALRLVNLENLPPQVHGDEGEFALSALGFLDGRFRHPFAVGWFHIPLLSLVPHALSMGLFGVGLFGTRVASVFLGVLGIPSSYLLLRLMFGRRPALMGALLLAVSPPHIHFSRLGLPHIQAPLASAVALYFLIRGLRRGGRLDFVWGGLALGLSLQIYFGARILLVVAVLFLGYQVLTKRAFLRRQGVNLVVMGAMALLTFAPLGLYFWDHPDTLVSRSREVYLFTEGNRAHFRSIYGTDDTWEMLRVQLANSLLTFNWRGDTGPLYGFREPLLDPLTAPVFVLGLAYSMRQFRDERHLLLLLWFGATLLVGGVLTVDAPSYQRLVALFPVVYAFAAIAADRALAAFERALPRWGRLALVPLLLLWLAGAGYANYQNYFQVYPTRDRPRNWITEVALYMRQQSPQYQVYLVTEPILYFNYGTLRFLAPEAQGRSTAEVSSLLPIRDAGDRGALFILAMSYQDQLAEVRRRYPGGLYRLHEPGQGRFISYLVSPKEVAQVAQSSEGSLPCLTCPLPP